MNKYNLGEVVKVHNLEFGVITALPTEDYGLYRVRISTTDFDHYVEVGTFESEMRRRGE